MQERVCRECHITSQEGDFGWARLKKGWFCKACREAKATRRRKATAERLMEKSKVTTVERDGQTFTLVRLPAKRR